MKISRSIATVFLAWLPFATQAQPFNIHVIRQRVVKVPGQPSGSDLLVSGSISVNGEPLGKTYENFAKRIPPGRYIGVLRHYSAKKFVLDASGTLTHHGDFLIEVGGVPGRSGIEFHAGDQPRQSTGCIMLGAIGKNPLAATRKLSRDHPLRKMRALFYGFKEPSAMLKRRINIVITDTMNFRRE